MESGQSTLDEFHWDSCTSCQFSYHMVHDLWTHGLTKPLAGWRDHNVSEGASTGEEDIEYFLDEDGFYKNGFNREGYNVEDVHSLDVKADWQDAINPLVCLLRMEQPWRVP